MKVVGSKPTQSTKKLHIMEEIRKYLKNNLKIAWDYDYINHRSILVLKLEGEVISELPFDLD